MTMRIAFLNPVVAAFAGFLILAPAHASDLHLSDEEASLLEQLRDPQQEAWQRIERQLIRHWSRSGSASADLLLQRGRDAMRRGNSAVAIEHFSALIDHAPDFAEGYHSRATAWFMDGKVGRALSDLTETLARNPNHFGALTGLGRIFEDLSDFDRARKAYLAAEAIHPHRNDVKAALERLEQRLGGVTL
jgi:tetratricopeptide (TPR) repeat protein